MPNVGGWKCQCAHNATDGPRHQSDESVESAGCEGGKRRSCEGEGTRDRPLRNQASSLATPHTMAPPAVSAAPSVVRGAGLHPQPHSLAPGRRPRHAQRRGWCVPGSRSRHRPGSVWQRAQDAVRRRSQGHMGSLDPPQGQTSSLSGYPSRCHRAPRRVGFLHFGRPCTENARN
jgi:hypothetical protein